MENFFKFKERGTNLRTEVLAGVVTFMTMAYIIFVNPGILSAAFGEGAVGAAWIPALATATTLGAALMCICMGVFANRPLALASGMGLNAVVAFSIILGAGVPWQVGMSVIFVEGLVILVLVMTGLRESIMNAIPLDLKRAIGVGIGLFITFIGLVDGKMVVGDPNTLVKLGDFTQPAVWVTLIGLVAIVAFMALKIKGDILWGIVVATVAALILKVTSFPTGNLIAMPDFRTFLAPFQTPAGTDSIALFQVFTPTLLLFVFAVMLTDFFDTMGTVISVGEQAGFVEKDGKVPGIRNILAVDSAAAAVGGLFGASSITTYIESAAGVAEGGRTGLTAIVTGVLFALCAFFSPVIAMVGGSLPITAGALIVVGFLMMSSVKDIPWGNFEEAFPAFLVIVGIPLTYNISYGIGLGFISYVIIKVFHGKTKDIHWLMWIVAAAFVVSFILPAIQKLVG
ncbi:MAG: NCS2 family permease [Actinomycetota bacterium]|nr:MAG: putative MFS transporter AGZA family xanthine/uracil [Actinomycetota bacterium]MDO8949939.1 NCS2 family permease [Actinomycetota bacterium]MDP3631174.1 NCS2 family permease [Actinomycetota bacterium]